MFLSLLWNDVWNSSDERGKGFCLFCLIISYHRTLFDSNHNDTSIQTPPSDVILIYKTAVHSC